MIRQIAAIDHLELLGVLVTTLESVADKKCKLHNILLLFVPNDKVPQLIQTVLTEDALLG